MYTIFANETCIYNDLLDSENLRVINPKLVLSDNSAGSLTITIPPTNIGYDLIQRMVTDIIVLKNGEEIWRGRVLTEGKDFWNNRKLTCEGELAFLNDTTQPQAEYHDVTVRGFLEALISVHNSKVAADRRFDVGMVTVTDSNDALYRYTNYEKTIECINDKLISRLGGHLRIRRVNGVRTLDYLADYPNQNTQQIEFGQNLLEFTRNWDMANFATVILPLGARLDESPIETLDAYLTVASVNSGSIYVQSASAVESYGWIEKVVHWDDVTTASALLTKATLYLSDIQFDNVEIELNAIDLSYLNSSYESIKLLDNIRVVSKPHGMDHVFPVSKIEIPLDKPEESVFKLGNGVKVTLTSASNSTNNQILQKIEALPKESEILDKAKQNATTIINSATNGYITIAQRNGYASELYIADDYDLTEAIRLWRWNLNGLGYSQDGGTTWGLAITMDGSIVADYITTGTLNADIIKTGTIKDANSNVVFNLTAGTLTINRGSINLGNGKFQVNSSGHLVSTDGQVGGFTINSTSIYNSVLNLSGNGLSFTKDSVKVGEFSSSSIVGHDEQRGITMRLTYDGYYIGWAAKTTSVPSDPYYLKLAYVSRPTDNWTDTDKIYLGCDINGNGYTAHNLWIDSANGGASNGISGTMNFVQVKQVNSNGAVTQYVNGCSMVFQNGLLVGGSFNA